MSSMADWTFTLLCKYERSDFYELLQQQKQLKTREMNEALSDIYNEGLNILILSWTHSHNLEAEAEAQLYLHISSIIPRHFPWEIVMKTILIGKKIYIQFYDKKEHPPLS